MISDLDTIRYDTIEEFNVDSKAENSALSIAHVARKKTKTNKRQCPFNTVQVKIREGSPEGEWRNQTVIPSNADSLKLQLLIARKKEWWPATADSLTQAVTCKLWSLAGIEPTTFRLLVRRATSRATETTNIRTLLSVCKHWRVHRAYTFSVSLDSSIAALQ